MSATPSPADLPAAIAAEREATLRRTAPNIVRDDPAEAARAEAARLAECERRQRRAEIEARLRKLPFSPIDPASPPAVAVAVQPKPVTTITTLREPRPMTDPVAVTPPSIGDGVPADLPSVTGASPANVRRVWAAARDLAAECEPATTAAIVARSGVSRAVVFKVGSSLRKAGRWPAPPVPIGRPRNGAGTPPGVPRAPRPAPEPPVSAPDSPDRVLGPPGGIAAALEAALAVARVLEPLPPAVARRAIDLIGGMIP